MTNVGKWSKLQGRSRQRNALAVLVAGWALLAAICIFSEPIAAYAEDSMTEPERLDQPQITEILFHPRQTGRTPPPAETMDIDLPVGDDAVIGCRLFSAGPSDPLILFFHGNGETVPDYDEVGPLYTRLNINFLVVDYRGYGWSSGNPSASAMIRDGKVLFTSLREWLTANGYDGPLFIMGRSLGSASAIDLAARYNDQLAGLIIESGFAETIPLARTLGIDLAAMGLTEKDGFRNDSKIEKVLIPTLIIHGGQDSLIPLRQAELLHAACGARSKELQIVPGADHNSLMATAGMLYFQTIRQFLDKITGTESWRKRRKRFKDS